MAEEAYDIFVVLDRVDSDMMSLIFNEHFDCGFDNGTLTRARILSVRRRDNPQELQKHRVRMVIAATSLLGWLRGKWCEQGLARLLSKRSSIASCHNACHSFGNVPFSIRHT